MVKEVSQFMQYLLPADMARKIELLRKEKIKSLYGNIFESNEVIEFKDAMEKLENEAKSQVSESNHMPSNQVSTRKPILDSQNISMSEIGEGVRAVTGNATPS